MIRIKDIADRAGVSPTTVSNVIHGKTGRVSKATVEKINRILKEMDPDEQERVIREVLREFLS